MLPNSYTPSAGLLLSVSGHGSLPAPTKSRIHKFLQNLMQRGEGIKGRVRSSTQTRQIRKYPYNFVQGWISWAIILIAN